MSGKRSTNMATVYVTYPGDPGTRFDRDYYIHTHLPLVCESWKPYGLQSAAAFFPSGEGAGILAVCLCQFRDEAAIAASFGSPESGRVMADIAHFTDAKPSQSRAVPL